MKRPSRAHMSSLLLIVLAALAGGAMAARASPPPQPATMHHVFLSLVMQAGKPAAQPTQPPPVTPTPLPVRNGFFAMNDWLTYNATIAIDTQGGMHLAFYASDEGHQDEPRNQAAYYAYCGAGTAACTDPGTWGALVQIDTQVNEVQVAVTSDGRPRLLIRRNGNRGYEYDYWACEAQCDGGQNWNGLLVTEAAGVELHDTDNPQRSFALDSQGRPRFVWSNGWGNRRSHGLYYAWCDESDCTLPDTWQHLQLAVRDDKTTTADYASLVFDGDRPRVLTRINYSGVPVETRYYECDMDCSLRYNWDYGVLRHPEGNKQWASWDLALDANGKPRVALYEPAGIDIAVGGKLFYAWCDTNCRSADDPFQMVQVANGEGQSVDLTIEPSGRTHMVFDAGQRGVLGELWCNAGCTSADSWQRRILETSEQLSEQLAPASPLTCGQQERVWFDAIPQVAFDRQGKLVVGYDATNYARCYTVDPADPTHRVYTEVKRIWWAVRLSQFDQP